MKNQTMLAHFGRSVRHFRQAAGWSQDELAQKCSKLRIDVAELEAGNVNPTLSMMLAIAQALGVEPAALVSGDSRAGISGVVPQAQARPAMRLPPDVAGLQGKRPEPN